MGLPSRRSLTEARIKLGPFNRFLLLYGAMFAAFGVASPFLPALHERGLGPSEIGAVLAAGTAVRLITGPIISRLADRFGKHSQILAILLAVAAVIAFGYSLPAAFGIFLIVSVAHASMLAPIVPIADAMTLAAAPGRFQYGWVRGAASAALICSPKTGPFRIRVFRVIFPWLGGAEDDESLEVFGRPKGVHSPAGR
jgi:MFS family permease